ncbi:MAG: DUF1326 domain-containing protein [candidate division Zixibacteria bacterium]|nr:DUF1326 domain-containing protein [candidate division Zixibacteria bacterium]
MKKLGLTAVAIVLLLAAALAFAQMSGKGKATGKNTWSFDAKIIEACSCRLMCSCYFNASPDKHFCQFNNAYNVISGNYGGTKLNGIKFWVSGDLGENFGDGTAEWMAVTFDPATTQEQMDAIPKILAEIYPIKAEILGVEKKPISWEIKGDKATAKIGDGTDGMVELAAFKDKSGKTSVINNLTYFGAKSNKGFALHKSKHHFKGYGKEYGFEDANGFVIEIISSGEIAAK